MKDVYVVAPRESGDKNHYWLLMTAAYVLINAGAKWQQQSDTLMKSLESDQLVYVPQLFYLRNTVGELIAVAVKVLNDFWIAGEQSVIESLVDEFQKKYELRTVLYGPAHFYILGRRFLSMRTSVLRSMEMTR